MGEFNKILKLNPDVEHIKIPGKVVLGLYEYVTIKKKKVLARIDSGAVKSSIDLDLAKELKLGPVIGTKEIKNVHGSSVRKLIEQEVCLCSKKIKSIFTLQNRQKMKFKLLIGQNILTKGFVIDPNKRILVK
jgi:hypothetical protein